jgi:hypothetical protein
MDIKDILNIMDITVLAYASYTVLWGRILIGEKYTSFGLERWLLVRVEKSAPLYLVNFKNALKGWAGSLIKSYRIFH